MHYLSVLVFSLVLLNGAAAEGPDSGGSEFRKTASKYEMQAAKEKSRGNTEVSSLYSRLAAIKLDAAEKADKGDWDSIDWTEYHAIEGKIASLQKKPYKK